MTLKIITEQTLSLNKDQQWVAFYDGDCEDPEITDPHAYASTPDQAMENFIKHHSKCEYDCSHVCIGCDQYFHDIKIEHCLDHEEELYDSIRTNAGNYYCHPDCLDSNTG